MEIKVNSIVTSFDGKNFWPMKVLKVTKTRATVIQCNMDGVEKGEPVTKKIDYFSGGPSVQFHPQEIVYLTRPYDNSLYMSYTDK